MRKDGFTGIGHDSFHLDVLAIDVLQMKTIEQMKTIDVRIMCSNMPSQTSEHEG